MPLRLRHPYTAVLPDGLPASDINRPRSSPLCGCAPQPRAQIRQVRAGGSSLGAFSRWFLTYTFPSRLPGPPCLAVPRRPVVVEAASTPVAHPCHRSCLQLHQPAATGWRRCPFITARSCSASWRSRSETQSASGLSGLKLRRTRSPGRSAASSGMGRTLSAASGDFVCYGGPTSYVMERADHGLAELLRVASPRAPLLLSVMSTVGSTRSALPAVLELAKRVGVQRVSEALDNGLLTEDLSRRGHLLKLYRWQELEALLARHPCSLEIASASNFLTNGRSESLAELVEDEAAWNALLDWELHCCQQKGAVDGGTHMLAVVT
jgi:hypothetical protein